MNKVNAWSVRFAMGPSQVLTHSPRSFVEVKGSNPARVKGQNLAKSETSRPFLEARES